MMTPRFLPRATVLACALLGSPLLAPAVAQELRCLDANGQPIVPAPGTQQGNAHGDRNTTCSDSASAYGETNNASAPSSSALGFRNRAYGAQASAIGATNTAGGAVSVAVGAANTASGDNSSAVGYLNTAAGLQSVAIGAHNRATQTAAVALGYASQAHGAGGVAVGRSAYVGGARAVSVGMGSAATGEGAVALGGLHDVNGNGVMDRNLDLDGDGTLDVSSTESTLARGRHAVAIGAGAQADHAGSVALGQASVTDRANSLSVGSAAQPRQITHVAAGSAGSDAVNLAQMNTALATVSNRYEGVLIDMARAFGGGASYGTTPYFRTPQYVFGGAKFNTVGDAMAHLYGLITNASWPTGGGGGSLSVDAAPVPAGATGRIAAAAPVPAQLHDVAAGTAPTDAVNVQQMQNADAATLAAARGHADATATATLRSANAYTDARFGAWAQDIDVFRGTVDARFHQQDARIDRMGAMSAAMTTMAASTAGIRSDNRLGVGVGVQGGRTALAVGYQRALGERATLTVGGSFSGGDSSAGVGLGVGW